MRIDESEDRNQAIERFEQIPKMNLTCFSTPLEKCERLRKAIPGAPHIYVKRDDHIGYLCGGNKIRKLEYVMSDVLTQGATAVVTMGSFQSNHARATAMVSKRLGLECVLILNGEEPDDPRGNYKISHLLKAKVVPVTSREERLPKMEEVARSLEGRGERVYKVSLGASDEIGSLGLVKALDELVHQQQQMGIQFDAIIIGSSSGGTQAGLEVGKRMFGLSDLRILGISPDDPADDIKCVMERITGPMLSRLGMESDLKAESFIVDDSYIGVGYNHSTSLSEEATELFLETEGILLDPVYTSKSAAALIDYCRNGNFNPEDNVLFWHTGGLINLFE
jgi:1-aminocyclopropane-1-carboxylate deaminase/D-cysteine desulfhydrase-like pyridoxal-dependent ACC family enzyme